VARSHTGFVDTRPQNYLESASANDPAATWKGDIHPQVSLVAYCLDHEPEPSNHLTHTHESLRPCAQESISTPAATHCTDEPVPFTNCCATVFHECPPNHPRPVPTRLGTNALQPCSQVLYATASPKRPPARHHKFRTLSRLSQPAARNASRQPLELFQAA
jgi:hypothetical protein